MKKCQLLILITAFLIFSSCAKDIYVDYQAENANTGKVVLKPSTPTERTLVTVNDKLLVDRKSAKSVTINNIPDGDFNIHYTADNREYKDKLDVQIPIKMENGKEITKLVEVPAYSTGYWIYLSVLAAITAAIWSRPMD